MGVLHHVGTFLIFSAAVLLLVASISSPVVNNIAMMKVRYNSGNTVSFGTFGHCILRSGADQCSSSTIGYSPLNILKGVTNADYSGTSTKTASGLTNVMVLHPVACGLAFIAFFAALGSSIIGALIASALAFLAWLVALVVTVTDFVLWGIVKNQVNDNRGRTGANAKFDTAMWLVLAAMLALFFGMILVLFTCCSKRRKERRGGTTTTTRRSRHSHASSKHDAAYQGGYNGTGAPYRKKHFWQRSSRTTAPVARY